MLNDIMLAVAWILGMALMAGITSEDETKYRMRQWQKQKRIR